jgi:hypothetical protein
VFLFIYFTTILKIIVRYSYIVKYYYLVVTVEVKRWTVKQRIKKTKRGGMKMTDEPQENTRGRSKTKTKDEGNCLAQLLSYGFTIVPGDSGKDEYGFLDMGVTRYCIKPLRGNCVIGKYAEGTPRHQEDPSAPRYEIIYNMNDSQQIKSAAGLRSYLRKLGVEFIESPPAEIRREMASSLEKSLEE